MVRLPLLVAVALSALFVLAFSATLAFRVHNGWPVDFTAYYAGARALRAERNPYEVPRTDPIRVVHSRFTRLKSYGAPDYLYPPHVALAMRPLAGLEFDSALLAWECASAAAMLAAAWLIGRALGGGWRLPLAIGVLVVDFATWDTLGWGQIGGFLLLCLAVAFSGFMRGNNRALGIGLGLATILKVFPIIFVAYLAWRRQWRAVVIALITIVVLTVPVALAGDLGLLTYYLRHLPKLSLAGTIYATPQNPTLAGTAVKVPDPTRPRVTLLAGRVAGAALVLATVILTWPRGEYRRWGPLELALVAVTIHLVPGVFWEHHMVLLVAPVCVVLLTVMSRRRRRTVAGVLAVLLCLTWIQGITQRYGLGAELSRSGMWRLMVFPFLLLAAFWALAAWYLWRGKRRGHDELAVVTIAPRRTDERTV